jgi:hypothetical protein
MPRHVPQFTLALGLGLIICQANIAQMRLIQPPKGAALALGGENGK